MSAAASDSGDKKRKRADTPSPTQVLEFLKICGKLKTTPGPHVSLCGRKQLGPGGSGVEWPNMRASRTTHGGWVASGSSACALRCPQLTQLVWRPGVLPMLLSDVKGIDATR
eukprot:2384108-Rhodomonas_salina.1